MPLDERESADEFMTATYRALCTHGYADLTMQDIADESSRSKAALHYHYDSKRDLLLAFLDHLLATADERLAPPADADPRARVHAILDALLEPDSETEVPAFRTALLEITAQAPFDDGFRERLRTFDRRVTDRLAEAIADGVAGGAFRSDVDPEEAAVLLQTAVRGAQTRRVAVGDAAAPSRDLLDRFVADSLGADEGPR
jgi:AcrR family transcriptional regulator